MWQGDGVGHQHMRRPRNGAIQDTLPIDLPIHRTRTAVSSRTRVPPLSDITDLVLDFHRAFGLPRQSEPSLDVSAGTAALRLRLLAEEVQELGDAVTDNDLVAIADALADIAYVVFGTAVTYGIDLDAVVREVHRANMSKLDDRGRPLLRHDGKVLKSARYTPPAVATVLALQPRLF